MSRLLTRFSLKAQVSSIAVLGVLGLVGAGGVLWLTNSMETQVQHKLEIVRTADGAAQNAAWYLETARNNGNIFLAQKQIPALDRRKEAIGYMKSALTRLSSPDLPADAVALAQGITQLVDSYDAACRHVVELLERIGLTEDVGLQAKLRDAVHGVEDGVTKLSAQSPDNIDMVRLDALMLQMRRHEKDFMLRSDRKYVEAMAQPRQEFGQVLRNADVSTEIKRSIAGQMDVYQTGFQDLAADWANVPAATDQFRAVGGDLSAKVSKLASILEASYNEQSKAATAASERLFRLAMSGLAGIGLLIAALGLTVGFVISRRIKRLAGTMHDLAGGNYTVGVQGADAGDEVGAMARTVQVFKDTALQAQALEREQAEARERRVAEDARVRAEAADRAAQEAADLVVGSVGAGLERLAEGDLTVRLATPLPAAYEKLRADLNTTADRLRSALGEVNATSVKIRSTTDEIAQASDDLSRRTEQQAASLEETAAALEQITTTVRRSAEGAKHAGSAVNQARTDADKSGEIVRGAVAAMSEIEKSAQQISQIIGVIDEIAFQTNLLALNAGVEAARAGEAGRGFAVVASEVRALAQRSAEAAKEIKTLISTSTQQVGRGVDLVGETGRALHRIVEQVAEISVAVAEIASSAQEQATGLAEVNTAINQMDQVTQQNAAMVEQSTAASHALAQETEQLARLTGRFRLSEKAQDTAAAVAMPAKASGNVVQLKGNRQARGKLARKPAIVASPATEGWEEF